MQDLQTSNITLTHGSNREDGEERESFGGQIILREEFFSLSFSFPLTNYQMNESGQPIEGGQKKSLGNQFHHTRSIWQAPASFPPRPGCIAIVLPAPSDPASLT